MGPHIPVMPKFLDAHKMGQVSEDLLKQAQNQPKTNLGQYMKISCIIKKLFCLLDAQDKESVRKHHEKLGITCDWITEVKTTG